MAFDVISLFNLMGFTGVPPNDQGIDGDLGINNSTGKIYQKRNGVWVDTNVTIDTMMPEAGPMGPDGKSAYEVAVEQGFSGTPQEWLLSLVGATGNSGRGVSSVSINSSRHLIVTYTDNSVEDAGLITVGLAAVATSGSYNDLNDKPSIPTQVQSNWTQSDSGNVEFIKNKPVLGTAAFAQSSDFATSLQGSKADTALQGPVSYSSLTDKPTLGTASTQDSTAFATASQGAKADTALQPPVTWSNVTEKPSFSAVATSGSYNDLSNKPTIPTQVNADWNASSGVAQILNKPALSTVATTGAYADLSGKPAIPAAQVNSDWSAVSGVAQILNKPTIPAAQIQSNWTQATTGALDYIKNKPSLSAVATSGSYSDLTNKPVLAGGQAALTAVLIVGGSVDVTVTLSATMPSTTYQAVTSLTGVSVSVLGNLVLTVKTKTTTTVVVTAKNTGIASIAAGSIIEVIALG